MVVLGISAYYHDSAASLVKDGKLIAAIAEERLNRIKHYNGFPILAIKYCIEEASIGLEDIDKVVFYEKPFLKFERIVRTHINYAPKGLKMFNLAMSVWLKERLNLRKTLNQEFKDQFGQTPRSISFCRHHLSHAAFAYYSSGYDHCAIIVADAVGENAVSSIFKASSKGIAQVREQHFPHSLGLLYSSFTYFLGFKVNSDEYKVMGLAPYGKRESVNYINYRKVILSELVDVAEDGSVQLNDKHFTFMFSDKMVNNRDWENLFGMKRRTPSALIEQEHKDLALAIQDITCEILQKTVTYARLLTGEVNICISGGCAMNCAAIGEIKRLSKPNTVYVPFAPGDDGAAIGCALFETNTKAKYKFTAYMGPSYGNSQVKELIGFENGNIKEISDFKEVCKQVAQLIASGKVVAWFQDRMEFGPRALGNRSILADPRSPQMKEIVNSKVKFRESFRPFAPVVMEEYASEVFEINETSPYMTATYKVKDMSYPATTHIDGTARLQTVSASDNIKLYQLLNEFYKQTRCPLLLNTSFNVMGEPIVCSPSDAFNTFMKSGIDVLVINNIIIEK